MFNDLDMRRDCGEFDDPEDAFVEQPKAAVQLELPFPFEDINIIF